MLRTRKLEKQLNFQKILTKAYGPPEAKKIMMQMAVLASAESLHPVPLQPPERLHQLSGKRKGQFAVALGPKYRLILQTDHDPVPKRDYVSIDRKWVTAVIVVDI